MLIKCPECELQVSDKAYTCPHCGFPIAKEPPRKVTRKSNKRKRLPNGFGQISEIKGRNLRKPFRAMVTVGKTETGRPICKPLKPESFFETYNDAYAALVEYNKNPYDLAPAITMQELYERWSKEYYAMVTRIYADQLDRSWKFCSQIYKMRVCDIRTRHIKGCIEEGTAKIGGKVRTPNSTDKNRIKTLFNQMLDYAVEYEIVDRNYSRAFKLDEDVIKEILTVKKEHIPFTDAEISLFWKHLKDKTYADMILIQCYSGWRPQELCLIKLEDVDLEEWTFKGGMKTDAGKNRIVPIHSRIRPLVERRYEEAKKLGSEYLFNSLISTKKDKSIKYSTYLRNFNALIADLNINPEHNPHDCRKHFVTKAKECEMDQYAIKYIVGHKISDITEKVYTKREFDWLRKEIEKLR